MAGDGELNRIIKDLHKTVDELNRSYREQNLPVTDGSRELHSLCAQLEFLLQFDLKEKKSFFGQRKDYWDFLCQGLAQRRQEHEGIRFVTSLDKLKTPVGRGRAFLRYCLVHQQLAESLQLCLLDTENLREWYYARSPFLSPQRRAEILGSLYELDCVTFHLALHRADLDTAWPMFSETLVRPSPVAGSSLAKTALQTDDTCTGMHGWPNGITHPTVAHGGVPAHPCPPALAALQVGDAEAEDAEEDVEVKRDVKEEVEKDDDDEEEVKDVNVEVKKDVEEDEEEEVEKDEEEDGEEVEEVEVEEGMEEEVEEDEEEKVEDVDVEEEEEVDEDVEEEEVEDMEEEDEEDMEEEEVEDVDVEEDVAEEEDVEEDDEEADEKELEDTGAEELEAARGAGRAPQPDGDWEPGTSPPPGTGCAPGSTPPVPGQDGRTAASLRALVSRLRAELGQREAAARALAARLARAERRHQRRERGSARRAQLRAREAEALRETNAFLGRALAAAGPGGGAGALARAQEEARRWREVAEARGARLAAALAEAAALASRLRECRAALAAAGRPAVLEGAGAPAEVAAVEEALRRALELARGPQEPPPEPQVEGEPGTAADMAMRLATLATAAREEARQSRQQVQAQRQEVAQLREQLGRARQDGERWASALQRAQREALEREATRGAEQARQQELIRDMKGRLLELLREKDALWQKTEGINTPKPSPAPHDAGLCARCHKDFRLLSRRYNCRWAVAGTRRGAPAWHHGGRALTTHSLNRLCQGKVCHTCSVDVGKQGRCCLLCYQQRHPQAT
ncbi:RUN and FYVE domain-containing protein 4 isoform X1 [Falco peregrinus]|uniref:RUN and FYVE domain-containing protein 4 isoform X1 n=1 Tax=Falco peregrinus TaxID=8954 RepID=UPI002478F305|nr:RUN and FYVE domain-containing protein 4 isoform X1 [Falco peregrinus]XP_055669059.1 RUN and FYVE domain-containing protein 4 isoform X1 [Falco peregrinus]XP_055669060.1 RUN and FYVE domain-containing protein 4 isoform X1 [Falco peregrinus]XP_055669061.1 RUN and FYVE domain-containing protein 4 isoform X1 [Falco peregrinus]